MVLDADQSKHFNAPVTRFGTFKELTPLGGYLEYVQEDYDRWYRFLPDQYLATPSMLPRVIEPFRIIAESPLVARIVPSAAETARDVYHNLSNIIEEHARKATVTDTDEEYQEEEGIEIRMASSSPPSASASPEILVAEAAVAVAAPTDPPKKRRGRPPKSATTAAAAVTVPDTNNTASPPSELHPQPEPTQISSKSSNKKKLVVIDHTDDDDDDKEQVREVTIEVPDASNNNNNHNKNTTDIEQNDIDQLSKLHIVIDLISSIECSSDLVAAALAKKACVVLRKLCCVKMSC